MSIKKTNIKNILIALFCCITLFGCKKEPFDYRNKFLGNYNFVIQESSWNMLNGSHDTTYTNEGRIGYGSDANSILISFSGGGGYEIEVYEDGTIGDGNCRGAFESTKEFEFDCYDYSMSHNYTQTVTGYKK